MKQTNKKSKRLIALLSAVMFLTSTSYFTLATQPSIAANTDQAEMDRIKKDLLNDPDFIGQIGKKVQSNNDNHIKDVVKDYLITNPEIMLEVQDALEKQQSSKLAKTQSSAIQAMSDDIYNSSYDAVIGNPNGSVTIVEFYDYNCGYCKQSYPDMQKLIKNNPELRVILKDFPILGPDSVQAHKVAQAFKKFYPEKYIAFHKELLTGQGRANEEKAMKLAIKLGATEKQIRAEIATDNAQKPFMVNMKIAYALNINGTPSYIIGNEVLVGAVGENILEQKVKSEQNK